MSPRKRQMEEDRALRDAARTLLAAVKHAKGTPEAGDGLHSLHLEHCHVLVRGDERSGVLGPHTTP